MVFICSAFPAGRLNFGTPGPELDSDPGHGACGAARSQRRAEMGKGMWPVSASTAFKLQV